MSGVIGASREPAGKALAIGEGCERDHIDSGMLAEPVEQVVYAFIDKGFRADLDTDDFAGWGGRGGCGVSGTGGGSESTTERNQQGPGGEGRAVYDEVTPVFHVLKLFFGKVLQLTVIDHSFADINCLS